MPIEAVVEGQEGTVVEGQEVEQVEQVAAPELPVEAEQPAEEFDEDKEFARLAQEANARIAAKHGEEVPAPKAAVVDDEPAPVAAKEKEGEAKPAAPAVKDEELLAAVPEAQRAAIAARLKAAEDLRAENQRLAHDNRSQAGRVAAFQRKYEEAAGKRPAEVQQAATAEEQAEWTQFTQDYPDIAKAIEAKFKQSRPDSEATVKELAEYVESEKRARYMTEAFSAVESVHPGWRDKVNTPEFKAWIESSPAYVKLAASEEITDAIALLDLHDAHTFKSQPKPKPIDHKAAAEAAKLAARRGAQAEGARAPKNGNAQPNPGVDPNDGDQLFSFYADKSNARIRQRYQ